MKERKWKIRGGDRLESIVSKWQDIKGEETFYSGSVVGDWYGCIGNNLHNLEGETSKLKDYPEISYEELEQYLFSTPITYSLWL